MDKTPAAAVEDFLKGIASPKRRTDAEKLLELTERITGEQPVMWGTIIGFGEYRYKYESGREGSAPAAAFAPRKAALTIYLPDGVAAYSARLADLGPHTTGAGCVYIKDLDAVDLKVLEAILAESFRAVTGGTYTQRAREGKERTDTSRSIDQGSQ